MTSSGKNHLDILQQSPVIRSPKSGYISTAIAKMSDGGDIEVETNVVSDVLPKDVVKEVGNIKLFNKWDYDVEVRDISLTYV